MRRTVLIGAGGLALGLTLGLTSFAVADIVGPDNPINACVANKNGAVRIVGTPVIVGPDQPAPCLKSETPLQWNQQGIQGEVGPPAVLDVRVVSETFELPDSVTGVFEVKCDEGEKAIGG